MNCDSLEKEIVLYYLNELSPEERAAFLRHLQVCPDCARFAYRISVAVEAVRESLPGRRRVSLWPSVKEKILRRKPLLPRWALVPALSLMTAALIATSTAVRMQGQLSPPEMEIVKDLDLFAHYELLENMDVLDEL